MSSDVEALFAATLAGDYEDDAAWEAVEKLRRDRSREIFGRAAEWCRSDDPRKRARAADILCQLRREATAEEFGPPDWMFRSESYELISAMVEDEKHPEVLDSLIAALGHLYDGRGVPLILRFQDHAERNIRFNVSCSLGCYPNDQTSVRGMLNLLSDSDAEVRDWAVFGLAVLGDVDSDEIRDALLRCLADADGNVREEAAIGLGRRHDLRLLPMLRRMPDEPEMGHRVAEAAATLLGWESHRPECTAAEYQAALNAKFPE